MCTTWLWVWVARQFEYHPTEQILAVGGVDNEVGRPLGKSASLSDPEVLRVLLWAGRIWLQLALMDWNAHRILHKRPFFAGSNTPQTVLALCWLKRDPTRLVAASNTGRAALYKIDATQEKVGGCNPSSFTAAALACKRQSMHRTDGQVSGRCAVAGF
jgi:hypothetical protein